MLARTAVSARSVSNDAELFDLPALDETCATPSVSSSEKKRPYRWSSPRTRFTSATSPGRSNRTCTTYRSAGPITGLSVHEHDVAEPPHEGMRGRGRAERHHAVIPEEEVVEHEHFLTIGR